MFISKQVLNEGRIEIAMNFFYHVALFDVMQEYRVTVWTEIHLGCETQYQCTIHSSSIKHIRLAIDKWLTQTRRCAMQLNVEYLPTDMFKR